jgi:hypothetical protein
MYRYQGVIWGLGNPIQMYRAILCPELILNPNSCVVHFALYTISSSAYGVLYEASDGIDKTDSG